MAGLGGIVPILGLGGLAQGFGQGMQYGREIGQMRNEMAYRNAMLGYREGSLQERQQAQMASVQNALDNAIARGIGPYGGPDAYLNAARTYDGYARQYGLQPGSYLNIYDVMAGGASGAGGYAGASAADGATPPAPPSGTSNVSQTPSSVVAPAAVSTPGTSNPSTAMSLPGLGTGGLLGSGCYAGLGAPFGNPSNLHLAFALPPSGSESGGPASGNHGPGQGLAGPYNGTSYAPLPVGQGGPAGQIGSAYVASPDGQTPFAPSAAYSQPPSQVPAGYSPAINSGSAAGYLPNSAPANAVGGSSTGLGSAGQPGGGWQSDPFIVGQGGYQDQLAGYQADISAIGQQIAANPYADHTDEMARLASVRDRAAQVTNQMSDYVSRNYTGPDAWKAHWSPYQDALDSFDKGGMTGAELQYRFATLNRQPGGLGIPLPTRPYNFGMTDPKAIAAQWQKIDAAYQSGAPTVNVAGKSVPTSTFVDGNGSHNSALAIAMSPSASADIALKAAQQNETEARVGAMAAQDEARIRQMAPGPGQAQAAMEHRQRFPFDTGFLLPTASGSPQVSPPNRSAVAPGIYPAMGRPTIGGVNAAVQSGPSAMGPASYPPSTAPMSSVMAQSTAPNGFQFMDAHAHAYPPQQFGPVSQAPARLSVAGLSAVPMPMPVPSPAHALVPVARAMYSHLPTDPSRSADLINGLRIDRLHGVNPRIVALAHRYTDGYGNNAVPLGGRNGGVGRPMGSNGVVLASNPYPSQGVAAPAFGNGGPYGSLWSQPPFGAG
jgi:hypothetical protein